MGAKTMDSNLRRTYRSYAEQILFLLGFSALVYVAIQVAA